MYKGVSKMKWVNISGMLDTTYDWYRQIPSNLTKNQEETLIKKLYRKEKNNER